MTTRTSTRDPERDGEVARLRAILEEAGFRPGNGSPRAEQLVEAHELLSREPRALVVDLLRARREAEVARRECGRAAEAAGRLGGMLEELLAAPPVLCRLEGLRRDPGKGLRALCRTGGALRELSVHPRVEERELEALEPWQMVCVHPTEPLVIGTAGDPALFARAHGELVELRGWHERERRLVRVARQGLEEEIVALSSSVDADALGARSRLVLLRDDPHWAIAVVPEDRAECRFEVPVDAIATRLADLAGLEEVIERMVEDLLLRLLRPDLRELYDLPPLRGMLLYSYRPGMGKTALMRATAAWLRDVGRELGFDVALYVVQPGELKIVWHGGDARLVREELCGALAARRLRPRSRPLVQIVVLDEIDSLGKRAGGDDGSLLSSAQNDAVQALLAEMDGMVEEPAAEGPPAHVLWVGLTNRPDMLDGALKRPGRFGDLVLEMPGSSREAAAEILAVYARSPRLSWHCGGELRAGLGADELRERFLRPAVARVFDAVVLRYSTDGRADVPVSAGEVMASVHWAEAMGGAKRRAARRRLAGVGVPAVGLDDLVEALFEQAAAAARQMEADRGMLARELRIQGRVVRAQAVPEAELSLHRFLAAEGA